MAWFLARPAHGRCHSDEISQRAVYQSRDTRVPASLPDGTALVHCGGSVIMGTWRRHVQHDVRVARERIYRGPTGGHLGAGRLECGKLDEIDTFDIHIGGCLPHFRRGPQKMKNIAPADSELKHHAYPFAWGET